MWERLRRSKRRSTPYASTSTRFCSCDACVASFSFSRDRHEATPASQLHSNRLLGDQVDLIARLEISRNEQSKPNDDQRLEGRHHGGQPPGEQYIPSSPKRGRIGHDHLEQILGSASDPVKDRG